MFVPGKLFKPCLTNIQLRTKICKLQTKKFDNIGHWLIKLIAIEAIIKHIIICRKRILATNICLKFGNFNIFLKSLGLPRIDSWKK